MSFNLKHIPCPRAEACTAFKCVFSHPHEEDQASVPAPAPDGKRPRHRVEPSSSDPDEPSKRPKVDQGSKLPDPNKEHDGISDNKSVVGLYSRPRSLSPSTAGYKADARADNHGRNKADDGIDDDKSVVEHSSRRRSPSPRDAAVNPSAPGAAANPSAPGPTFNTSAPVAATEQRAAVRFSMSKDGQQPKQNKIESLNPRLLVSSPARHETRVKLIKALHQEYTRLNSELKQKASDEELKLLMSSSELITKTLDDEQNIANNKPAVYANVMKNTVMQHKRMELAQWKVERAKAMNSALSGSGDQDDPNKIWTGLTRDQEVAMLRFLYTPIHDLSEYGYISVVPTEEAVEEVREAVVAGRGWEKCDRCRQRFQVFPGRREHDGALTSGGACNFHWGKKYIPAKAPGDKSRPPKRFQCCEEEEGESNGCLTHDYHVYKTVDAKRLATLFNYVETPPNKLAPTDRAVCFDCEMGYTVYGMELVRLTATSWPTGEELLDVLVQPKGEILDLNSRYSGVWPNDLALAELWTSTEIPPLAEGEETKKLKKVPSPAAARELLFSLISPDTPLIGHGLENDLNAVRIVHPTLIDTVLLYPHRAGLPYRRGLKSLMEEQLNRKIQQDTGPKTLGHDSAEDARAAGDLVLLEVKHEWKRMQRQGLTDPGNGLPPPHRRSRPGK
ncbi:RNA exonuclease 3 [Hirsutella rhossiliensis]|uniref:RNA exonuclease 3 n=1 Tax=Hirsutella rhossiliensis TaxID=111463 RepID=A0A9P8SG24_9HYPO|nr:RNA exonuclease 3 [Hirsutella rhossiliensis]KAH0959601.1 RNA exonuclease 3 [Hirsutella rhossiliensis]